MALRLISARPETALRAPQPDLWRTISAWVWTAYFALIAAMLAWWLL